MVLFATLTRPNGTRVLALREEGSRVDFARFHVLVSAGGRGAVDIAVEGWSPTVWLRARSAKSVPCVITNWLLEQFPQLDLQVIFPVGLF